MQGCNDLGALYADGKGVPKDEVRATSLYEVACSQHNVSGCANLGWHLYKGIGIKVDKPKGRELLAMACGTNDEWACAKEKLAL